MYLFIFSSEEGRVTDHQFPFWLCFIKMAYYFRVPHTHESKPILQNTGFFKNNYYWHPFTKVAVSQLLVVRFEKFQSRDTLQSTPVLGIVQGPVCDHPIAGGRRRNVGGRVDGGVSCPPTEEGLKYTNSDHSITQVPCQKTTLSVLWPNFWSAERFKRGILCALQDPVSLINIAFSC